ncbi:hypothetical protein IQ273_12265 [Nodosilinea sp. LEGE 07298]|uniref:hypothetical protein n=1 Tax=Nodosilinea sp. LEGE 07298 TaxID=2777970 RepID=UPI00187EB04C|nr:hypothetical protein [Nodosilinea sp. LEGE 07298]MBE9110186.1 hypothetical protein [Nodosilinea sp. LEGE 07298]
MRSRQGPKPFINCKAITAPTLPLKPLQNPAWRYQAGFKINVFTSINSRYLKGNSVDLSLNLSDQKNQNPQDFTRSQYLYRRKIIFAELTDVFWFLHEKTSLQPLN